LLSQHIDFINPTIAVEYERRLSALGDDDYEGPTTLGIRDVLKAHFLIADFFAVEGEGLGGVGPKSLDLLHSALFRQSAHVGQPFKTSSRFDVCATLFFGIVKNHCFHDANKRTALLCLLFHLEKIGYCPAIPQVQLEDFAVEVADNALGKYARYNEFQKSSEFDANVAFISDYFKCPSKIMLNLGSRL
jgi:death-on-curing protein